MDARPPVEFERGHISGEINITPSMSRRERQRRLEHIDPSKELIVYCSNSECRYSHQVAGLLYEDGHEQISVFSGGWAVWASP